MKKVCFMFLFLMFACCFVSKAEDFCGHECGSSTTGIYVNPCDNTIYDEACGLGDHTCTVWPCCGADCGGPYWNLNGPMPPDDCAWSLHQGNRCFELDDCECSTEMNCYPNNPSVCLSLSACTGGGSTGQVQYTACFNDLHFLCSTGEPVD